MRYNKSALTTIVIPSLLTLYALSSCSKNDSVSDHDHAGHHHTESEAVHQSDKHSEGEIVVDPEIASQMGVTAEVVKSTPLELSIKGIGSVALSSGANAVASATTSGTVSFMPGIEPGRAVSAGQAIARVNTATVSGGDINRAAKAEYDAAKTELDRLKPLYEERLVTATQYNEAVKNFERTKSLYSQQAASGLITSPVSGYITTIDVASGQYVDAGTPIASISSTSQSYTLRVDVPQRYFKNIADINDALIVSPYSDTKYRVSDIGGKRISATKNNATALSGGFAPVYFTLPADCGLPVGSSAEVYLLGIGTDNVISVPFGALSEQQGQMYVFLRLDEDCYKKAPVKIGRTDGSRVEITEGLHEGDNVVVTGTTTVRIAESSGVVPEGHSHNH